jgi:hypothetical protein
VSFDSEEEVGVVLASLQPERRQQSWLALGIITRKSEVTIRSLLCLWFEQVVTHISSCAWKGNGVFKFKLFNIIMSLTKQMAAD